VLDEISVDYEGQVTFVAVGGGGTLAATGERATEWMPSGRVLWGLDESQHVWDLIGASGTPSAVLLGPDGKVFTAWSGALGEAALRENIDALISDSA
jgi:hypothetical protein